MTAATLAPAAPADTRDGYRQRVRAAAAFAPQALRQWETERHLPRTALAQLGSAGVFRDRWAPGAGGGLAHLVTLSEELFAVDSGLALAAMGHSEIFIGALTRHGRGAAHRELLARALDGDAVGCFAATEPHGGSNLAGLTTQARRLPDGWHLTGTKRYVSNLGSATHVVLLARAAGARRSSDLTLFVVPLDLPGMRVDGFFDTAGVRSCDVGQLSVDVTVPADAALGIPGLGLLYASHLLQFERLAICAQLIAAGETALDLAAAFARRRALGAGRVLDKQVIRHRLALAQAELWNLRSRLEALVALGGESAAMPAHEIAALKLSAGHHVSQILDTCMQVFGARGNTSAYPLERLVRDCRVARIGGGTDEVLADMVAALVDRPRPDAEERLDRAALADLAEPQPLVPLGAPRACAL